MFTLFNFRSSLIAFFIICLSFEALALPQKIKLAFLKTHPAHQFSNSVYTSIQTLSVEVESRTSIDLEAEFFLVELGNPNLEKFPILVSIYQSGFLFDEKQGLKKLMVHLKRGGMWLIDFNEEPSMADLEKLRRVVKKVFPGHKLKRIDKNKAIFQSFYLLDRLYGRTLRPAYWEAIDYGSRLPVMVSYNGAFSALSKDSMGNFEFSVSSGVPRQREMVKRSLINFLMYALCLDYKKDQVHVPFILKRRR